ncbi:MAG: aldolase/citrate lyase family protein [Elioraea sp.]|nr:aldolase/citrate lyase family protein [Elioraea sp.]MDW8444437.1 aldolase/citrate lyase family protein [Acetobacteraceae bacterium]
MRPNRIRELWAAGKNVVNGWLGIPSSVAAEAMAQAGWDSLTIDLQHGMVHFDTAVPMLQAISTTPTVPLARVPWNEPGIIMKMLDAGAYGIICPMVSSRAECERFVGACRYPPHGYRSFGPLRAAWYAGTADYWKHANRTVLTFAMIETAEALANLEEIVTTPGLDAVYVGPNDLALAIGETPAIDPVSERTLAEVRRIAEVATKHGVMPGIHTGSADGVRRMFALGYRFATILGDSALLTAAAKAAVAAAKGGEATAATGTY